MYKKRKLFVCAKSVKRTFYVALNQNRKFFYKSLRLLLHSLFYPIYHKADNGVFIKVVYKLLGFLSYWNVNRLLLDYTEQEVVCQSV